MKITERPLTDRQHDMLAQLYAFFDNNRTQGFIEAWAIDMFDGRPLQGLIQRGMIVIDPPTGRLRLAGTNFLRCAICGKRRPLPDPPVIWPRRTHT